jgi:hypothetical protein
MFCDHCILIRLDDQHPVFSEFLLSDGRFFRDRKGRSISQKWSRPDVFPHFPALLKSAQNGCGCCEFLRNALQHRFADQVATLSSNGPKVQDVLIDKIEYWFDDRRYIDPTGKALFDARDCWQGIENFSIRICFTNDTIERLFFDVLVDRGVLS